MCVYACMCVCTGDGMGRRFWCGEEVMVWGGGEGHEGHILDSSLSDLELVKQQQMVSASL